MKQFNVVNDSLQKFFFFLIILFIPSQLGKHFWPPLSYVLGLRIDYLSPTIYFTDILIVFLFVCFLYSKKFITQIRSLVLNRFFVIFFLTLLIGILFSKSPLAGFYGLIKLLEFLFFGYSVSFILKEKKNYSLLPIIFSFGILFESFLTIAQYLNKGSLGGIFYFFGERFFTMQTPGIANASINGELVSRPYGTFPHPNVLAAYLLIGMTVIIFNFKFLIFKQFPKLKKLILFFSILFGSIALFLTMSRVAIVLWLFVVMLNLFQHLKSSKIRFRNEFGITVVFFFISTLLFFSPLLPRFLNSSLTDESIVVRENLIESSIILIKSSPIFGIGINNFLQNLAVIQKINSQSLFTNLQPVHNIYFLILSETGIIGFVFFLWFIFKTFKRVKNKTIIHYSFIILFEVLVLGLFDHYFLTLQQGELLFAFVLGLCWAKTKDKA